jgi:hypothetical protein
MDNPIIIKGKLAKQIYEQILKTQQKYVLEQLWNS